MRHQIQGMIVATKASTLEKTVKIFLIIKFLRQTPQSSERRFIVTHMNLILIQRKLRETIKHKDLQTLPKIIVHTEKLRLEILI